MDEIDDQNMNLEQALAAEEQANVAPPEAQGFVEGVRQRAAKLFPSLATQSTPQEPAQLSDMQKIAFENAVRSGFITPQNYQQEVQKLVTQPELQTQLAGLAAQRFGVGQPSAAVMERERQQEVAPMVKGTPAEVEGVNTVLAPAQDVAANAAAQAASQAAEAELAAQKVEQDAALEVAAADADRKAQTRKVQNEAAAQTKAAERVEQADEAAKAQVPAETPEEGLSMRQAFAILLGGLSQGLTGAKENPAITMIEAINERRMKRIEQEAKQKQWSEEQKLAVQKAEMERQMNMARMYQMNVENELARAKIGELEAKGQEAAAAIAAKQGLLALEKARGLTIDEVRQLTPDEQEQYVQLPNGNFTKAANKVRAKELSAELSDMETAKANLSRLIELTEEVGNNPLRKVLDRNLVAEAQTLQQSTIGKLRLELFGPGVLTDSEQKIARNILRDPTNVLSLASANKAALQTLQKKLKYGQIKRIEAAGGVVPDSLKRNELLLKKAQEKYPKAKKADLISALMKQGLWQDE